MPAPTPETRDLFRDGALTVRAAQEFSGLSRNELWDRMDDGTLPWFMHGKARLLSRRALADYLERLYATTPQPKRKRAVPKRRATRAGLGA
jgi:hypothetical protein